MPTERVEQRKAVAAAFGKQSIHFDADDSSNSVLQEWRRKIYSHVNRFVKPNSRILELNAGTGIDASYFAGLGHTIHATDISDGMIEKLKEKASKSFGRITVQQVSFDQLDKVEGTFDYVFSNFGGLNCTDDLGEVTKHLPRLLKKKAFVTLVIMPRITPWEWTWILRRKFTDAFRRLRKEGALSHLEGERFYTYYHSLGEVTQSFDSRFCLLKSEGLGIFSPPPSAQNFVKRFSSLASFLSWTDSVFSGISPFNRWGDHVIVTFLFNEKTD